MADEKIMTINLRKGLKKSPRWDRSRKATSNLRKILLRHTKSDKLFIDPKISQFIWRKSIERPVSKIRVKITKKDSKTSKIELVEAK